MTAQRCGARRRNGLPCRAYALPNRKRCRLHGGLSTGARTPEGREKARRVRDEGKKRWLANMWGMIERGEIAGFPKRGSKRKPVPCDDLVVGQPVVEPPAPPEVTELDGDTLRRARVAVEVLRERLLG